MSKASYPKIWTTIRREPWFMKLNCSERGFLLQLFLIAKDQGDTGTIVYRSWHGMADDCGLDQRTCRKFATKLQQVCSKSAANVLGQNTKDAKLVQGSNTFAANVRFKVVEKQGEFVSIKIVNYRKWQDKREVNNDKVATNLLQECNTITDHRTELNRTEPRLILDKTKKKDSSLAKKTSKKTGKGIPVWEWYSAAFETRYDEPPPRNAKANSLCCQLVDRLGDEAPQVAEFFLTLDNSWYVQKGHSLQSLVADAESIRTQWKTGKKITRAKSTKADKAQSNSEALTGAAAELEKMDW